jgi:SAM-dependent methyltransferase
VSTSKYAILTRDFSNPFLSHSVILNRIGQDKKVLDVGCACGDFARHLRKVGCSVVGVEVDERLASQATAHCDTVIVGDIQRADVRACLAKNFDVILLADVLEHLVDPWTLLRNLGEHLRLEGIVVISVPNALYLPVRLKWLAGRFEYSGGGGITDINHLRWFSLRSSQAMLRDAGYQVSFVRGTPNCLRGRKLQRVPLLGRAFLTLSWVGSAGMARLLPGLFAYQIVLMGQPVRQ